VTEQEWLRCTDPETLLAFLRATGSTRARPLRLFACACVRRVWGRLRDERSRRAVLVAEEYAEGLAGAGDLQAAQEAAWLLWGTPATTAAADAARPDANETALEAARHASWACPGARVAALRVQADLLRDIWANPFRPAPAVEGAWRTATVLTLAQAIGRERQFGDLPVLADALEEAGCTTAEILSHLRGPGPHVRGCWVLDLLTGRE
jgi:hypothetical protein